MTIPKPWTLPLIVIAILAPMVVGLVVLGPQGMVLAAVIVGAALVIIASRPRRDRPIEVATDGDRHHALIVATEAIDDSRLAKRIANHVKGARRERDGADGEAEVLVVAPALNPLLDHWAADVQAARADAARRLEASLDHLRWAGLDARGAVGDSNPMLAIEDALRGFPADEVIVVTGEQANGELTSELRDRLDRPVEAMAPPSSA